MHLANPIIFSESFVPLYPLSCMSHGCREYIIIPDVDIPLTIINDVDNYTVPYDSIEQNQIF